MCRTSPLSALHTPADRSRRWSQRRRVPDLQGPVIADRDQLVSIRRAEDHTPDPAVGAFEREGLFAGARVPGSHGMVLAGRGQPLPVRAERHAYDLLVVAGEGVNLLALGIPDLYGRISAGRGEPLPIAA